MHNQLTEASSTRTILEKSRVKASYLDFWNHIKNNPALLPVYSPDVVEDLFDRASEIVARVRILLNRQNPSAQVLRNSCGLSKEKLWHGQLTEKQITSPEEFVRDLVHTSLQDVKGNYINDLTSEKVDEYIRTIEEFLDQNRSNQGKDLLANLRADIEESASLLQKIEIDNEPWKNYALYLNLKKLTSEGAALKTKIQSLITSKEQISTQLKEVQSAPVQQEPTIPQIETDTVEKKEAQDQENKEDLTEKKEEEKIEGKSPETTTTAQDDEKQESEKEKEPQTETPTQNPDQDSTVNSATSEETKTEPAVESPAPAQAPESQSPEDSGSDAEGSRTPTTTRKKYEIKINQVADDVSLLRGKVQHLSEIAEKLDLSELAKDPKEGSKAVTDLQKKCLQYTEHLMKNLLSLDEIIGSTSTRSQKKQQINTIQELMADMDSVNERLKKLSETLKAEAEAEKEREKKLQEEEEAKKKVEEEEKAKTPSSGEEKKKEEAVEEEEEEEEEVHRIPEKLWRSLKLNTSLDVRQFRDKYVIAGQLPGVRRQDLSVDISPNKTLVISGFRLPTEKEEMLMRKHAQAAWARNHLARRRVPVLSQQEEDRLILEMANGRYGTFSETYQLPASVDKTRISASLEKGVLQVVIPKVKQPVGGPFYDDYYW